MMKTLHYITNLNKLFGEIVFNEVLKYSIWCKIKYVCQQLSYLKGQEMLFWNA